MADSQPTLMDQQREIGVSCFVALSLKDFDRIEGYLSDDQFSYHFAPASLQGMGKPDGFDKQEIMQYLKAMCKFVDTFNFQPPNCVSQQVDNVVFHVRANGSCVDGNPYTNESIVIMTFEAGTNKLAKIVEFTDTIYVSTLKLRMVAHGVDLDLGQQHA
ncbi:hypothetical protein MNV49_001446 [Pseudohyphozyma bogoriensis]|nr:hypothetical protein MNV49_001446 [Pseudohyphozyma bogoriensis]